MDATANLKSGIRDNHARGAVGEYLGAAIREGCHMSVVSAFFTVYAYEKMKDALDSIGHMDFLFGEPRFVRSLDPERSGKKAFIIDSSGLRLANVLQQKRVARECADWIRAKVSIRSVRQSNFLHGKMYHIAHQGVEQAILGSSNFTPYGLGLSPGGGNIELNLIVDSNRDRADLKTWFDNLWSDENLTADVKDDVLKYLAEIYQNHSPEFVYFKTLFHLFERFLEDTGRTDIDIGRTTLFETQVWKALFEFQKDGAKGAINKILAHNGCILADSVGLGKTYTALAVIKYFELRNERVLVLCPKKLSENWTVYSRGNDLLNPFTKDRFRFDVLSHTDLSRDSGHSGNINLESLNWGNYDLKDLRNQLYFISAGEDGYFAESIGIPDIGESLRKAQGQFTAWSKQPASKRRTADLLTRLGADFFKLLDQLTIARARKHIQKYYAHEIERLGKFPERLKPWTRSPDIDSHRRFMSYDKLSEEIDGYKLSLFNPSRFLRTDLPAADQAEYERKVGNFTQAQREDFLIGMMKVNFLKRLVGVAGTRQPRQLHQAQAPRRSPYGARGCGRHPGGQSSPAGRPAGSHH